jgi:hypothetical protein
MQTAEQAYASAASLYWIGLLLSGCPELSVAAAVEALDFDDAPDPVKRRAVIVKMLTAKREELAISAQKTAVEKTCECTVPAGWVLDPHTSTVQLEQALLAISLFPRCALLLTLFEGIKLEEASILLNTNRETVLEGRTEGLLSLTLNLARIQGWNPLSSEMADSIGGMTAATKVPT